MDVADLGSPVVGVSECSDPERADGVDVGSAEEGLSEARWPRIRSGPEFARSGLEVLGVRRQAPRTQATEPDED